MVVYIFEICRLAILIDLGKIPLGLEYEPLLIGLFIALFSWYANYKDF